MTKRRDGPNRRRVLGLGIGAAGGLAAPALVQADEKRVWRMTTAWPKDAPGAGTNANRLADMIGTLSGGRLTIQVFAAGELVAPSDMFDAVAAGTVELGHATSDAWQGRDQAFHFFAGVPFGLTGHEHAGWLRFGGGEQLWERAYAPFGVVPRFAGVIGPQGAGWFRREISTPLDLKELRMGIGGLGAEIMHRLGVETVSLPREELVVAFRDGKIDAIEWISPWNDLSSGLLDYAKLYYMPGFQGIGAAIELIVNGAAHEALPSDLKAVVRHAAMASAMETYADYTYNNISVAQPLVENGVELRTLPDAIVRTLARESEALLKEIAASSPMATEVYLSFAAFRAKATEYAKTGDLAALQMRQTALGT
jgi:TRAP-type mannitol/chloroaromatic compound transport system substrate-binding protein